MVSFPLQSPYAFGGFSKELDRKVETYYPTDAERDILELYTRRVGGIEGQQTTARELGWLRMVALLENDPSGFAQPSRPQSASAVPVWRKSYWSATLRPAAERAISAILGAGAKARVVPRRADTDSRERARLAQDVLSWLWTDLSIDLKTRYALLVAWTCGMVWLHPRWNPEAGELVGFRNGVPEYQGNVSLEVFPPHMVKKDPIARDLDHCRWVCVSNLESLDSIDVEFPGMAKYIRAEAAGCDSAAWREMRLRHMGRYRGAGDPMTERGALSALVHRLYCRPMKGYPRGLYAVICQGVVLASADNPYVVNGGSLRTQLPFVAVQWYEGIERIEGDSPAEAAEHALIERSRAIARLLESLALMSHPYWTAPKNSGLPDFIGAPGRVYKYNPAAPEPKQSSPAAIPEYPFRIIDILDREFNDVTAQNGATAEQAANIRSAQQMQLANARDSGVQSGTRLRLWNGLSRVASIMLDLVRANYRTERVATVVGPNGAHAVFKFKGQDLTDSTQVEFITDLSLGETREARFATVQDWLATGTINVADDLHLMLLGDVLDSGDIKQLSVHTRAAFDEARREISVMKDLSAGIPPRIVAQPHQISRVHVLVKQAWMATEEFVMLPEVVRSLATANFLEHQMRYQAELQAQQAQVQASKGAPGEKGKASAPKSGSSGKRSSGGQAA